MNSDPEHFNHLETQPESQAHQPSYRLHSESSYLSGAGTVRYFQHSFKGKVKASIT